MKKSICRICNFESKSIAGICRHIIFTHKISVKEYYDRYFKGCQGSVCQNHLCNNTTRFVGLKSGYNKYCSLECASSDPDRRKRIGDSNKRNWRKNPDRSEKLIERNKRMWKDDDLRKQILASLRRTGKTSKFQEKQRKNALIFSKDPKWRKKVSEGTKLGQSKNSEFREIRRQYMINGGAAYCNQFIKNPSKPQKELFNLVCEVISKLVIMNYQCLNFSIDIAIPDMKIAIEYDGSYWHQDPKADARRQLKIEEQGWNVIRYVDRIPTRKELAKIVGVGCS